MDADELVAALKRKKEEVRSLKKTKGNTADETRKAVAELQELQAQVKKLSLSEKEGGEKLETCDRVKLDALLSKRMFVVPSFDIYGGVKGLYDFGPPACALKANFLSLWRRHFVLSESMLEVECTNMTPHKVLDTSGHVSKFTDLMVKDSKSGECIRADHLLEKHIDKLLENLELSSKERLDLEHVRAQADAYSPKQLHAKMTELKIVDSNNKPFKEPFPFNLMFKTSIGPEGNRVGFLRPETAQGIFVNFKKLLEYNSGKMPFAAAQIGTGFRNEIAPRNGLLRVREFCMAEIEHFVNPEEKDHPRFGLVSDLKLPLFPQKNQLGDGKIVRDITLKDAVHGSPKVIDNETLAYFMARTFAFLCKVGVKPTHIRFRQHLKSEMAHYASDCWDAEIYLSYGWTECVGIADRSCFDLTKHAKASKVDMSAQKRFDKKQTVEVVKIARNRGAMGKAFKSNQKVVNEYLDELNGKDAKALDEALNAGNVTVKTCAGPFELTRDMVKKVTVSSKQVSVKKYLPGVIEPSFGVGRILYAIMEHSFYTRPEDANKEVMRFPICVAPVKCSVFSLISKDETLHKVSSRLAMNLTDLGVSCKTDSSGTAIGKRYVRTDSIGIPFAITVDYETVDKAKATSADRFDTVTLRERDTRVQIRVPTSKVCNLVRDLANGRVTWASAMKSYPIESDSTSSA